MSKPTKILSFNDYAIKGNRVEESAKPEVKKAFNKPVVAIKKPVVGKKPIKESAFAVGSDYKVKLALDIPQSLVSDFVSKVKKETGKDALANFTSEELAEEMIRYIVKTKLSVDNLSSAIAVGEGASKQTAQSDNNDGQENGELEIEEENGEEDPFKDETQEIEFEDEDDEPQPVKVQKGTSKMDFEGTEVNLGEKENIELDSNQPIKK